jgi:hypothetical protein
MKKNEDPDFLFCIHIYMLFCADVSLLEFMCNKATHAILVRVKHAKINITLQNKFNLTKISDF